MAIGKVAVLKTAEQIEKIIVTAILKGDLPMGSALPSERDLAARLGVTRPTLRETLKQLAKEGWLKIQHGKPTQVADYWQEGGLGVLRTLAKYGDLLSPELISHLLEFRANLQPVIALAAARRDPGALLERLRQASSLKDRARDYADYDWQLQVLMADLTGNPIYRLTINDFSQAFAVLAGFYFQEPAQRRRSQRYYQALAAALEGGKSVDQVVRRSMNESARVWQELTREMKGGAGG
jgi:GntR family negative regulator for fad regulon and positive regulator of fabA